MPREGRLCAERDPMRVAMPLHGGIACVVSDWKRGTERRSLRPSRSRPPECPEGFHRSRVRCSDFVSGVGLLGEERGIVELALVGQHVR